MRSEKSRKQGQQFRSLETHASAADRMVASQWESTVDLFFVSSTQELISSAPHEWVFARVSPNDIVTYGKYGNVGDEFVALATVT